MLHITQIQKQLRLITAVLLMVSMCSLSFSQVIDSKQYNYVGNWYNWQGGRFTTNLNIPKVTATTGRDSGALRYSISDSSVYVWTGSQWRQLGAGGGGGSGTVTSFSSGNLTDFFTTSVENATTTPALSFTIANTSQYRVWGRSASGTGTPSYVTIDTNFITDFYTKVRSLFNATYPIQYNSTIGRISIDTSAGKWRSEGYYDTKYALIGEGGGGGNTTLGTLDTLPNPKWQLTAKDGTDSVFKSHTQGWYNVKDYGMSGDSTVDITTNLQSLINTVVASGGGVIYFPPGKYLVAGALQNTDSANAQIVVPLVEINAPTISITFKGYQPPPNQFFTQSVLPFGGMSTIKSTLTGASGTASFLSGKYKEVGGIGFQQNVSFNIENMVFQAPNNPTFTMLNLQYFQGSKFDKVLINAGILKLDAVVEPTNSNSYGIKLPEVSHTPGNLITAIDVWGFYYGTRISELTIGDNINSWACKYGIAAAFGFHTNRIGTLGLYWCQNGIKTLGGTTPYSGDNLTRLRVGIIQSEHANGAGQSWQNRVYDIDDASNYLKGDGYYQTIRASVGEVDDFVVNGGANFFYQPIGTSGLNVTANNISNFQARVGTILAQSYATNNAFITDNGYFNGSAWTRRTPGYVNGVYFLGGQTMLFGSNTGTGTFTPLTNLKSDYTGAFALGANISQNLGSFSGSTFYHNSSGRTFLGGSTSATALLHLAAGTATASTAPVKFSSGTQLTTPEPGVLETQGTELKYSTANYEASRGFVHLARYVETSGSGPLDGNTTTCGITASGQTITLPTAVGITGRIYTIKLKAAGTGTVATTSSQTIDGSTTYSLSAQYKYVTVQSDGSNWIIIGNN